MKVSIDLPDEIVKEKTTLWIVGGIEPVAYFLNGRWYIKEGRCSQCGECCKDNEGKYCDHIRHELDGTKSCGSPDIPWACVRGHGGKSNIEGCTVNYKEIR